MRAFKAMLIFLSFLAFFLYIQLGLFVLSSNVRSKVNRSFFYLCCCLIIWSFGTIFIYLSPNESMVTFWDRFSSFGWTYFPALMVFFFIELRKVKNFKTGLIKLGFIITASLFFIQSLYGNLFTNGYYRLNDRWVFQTDTSSLWYWLFLFYLVGSLGYSIFNLISWSLKTNTKKESKQSRIIMITLILFFSGLFISSYVLPLVDAVTTPGMVHILSFVWITGFGYAIVKYKFMVLSPALAANAIISKMNELLFFVDNDGNVMRINTFTEQTLGYHLEEVVAKPFRDLIIEENGVDKITELDESDIYRFQKKTYLRQKSGGIIPFNLSSAEVKDDAGDVLGTIIVGYDVRYQKLLEEEIELRKKTEAALRESEDNASRLYSMVRLMCDNAPDMIWAKDLSSRFIFANNALCKKLLNAKDTDEPIGKTERYFYTREKKRYPENMNWFTFGDVSIDSDEAILTHREACRYVEVGNIFNRFTYLDVHKAPFFDENGHLIGIVGCGRDVTEEKRLEEQRREIQKALEIEKDLLSVTLKSIGDGVISTDIHGRIILMNSVAEELTGWYRYEVWGKHVSEILSLTSCHSKQKVHIPVSEAMETGKIITIKGKKPVDYQIELRNRGGKKYDVDATIAPIKNAEDSAVGTVIVFANITEKVKMENELIKIQKMESISILAGGIVHDFNNILTVLTGNLSLTIEAVKDRPVLLKRLQNAEKVCFRATDLIKKLLFLSKGSLPEKKAIYIEKIIEETALFALKQSQCELIINKLSNLHPVEADENQISQLMNNLVLNAKQSMPEGGVINIEMDNIDINDSLILPLCSGKYVQIVVKDQGIGIPEDYLQQIFDPFFTTKQEGTGLGLTSCFSIVKKHNGHILVDSQLGVGSTFTIFLPASESIPEETQQQEEDVALFREKGKVLIMDDDEEIVNVLSDMLRTIGYDVIVTKNGEEALTEFKKALDTNLVYKFIILDLTIERGMGGNEVIIHIRDMDTKVKIIVSSGYSEDPIVKDYAKHGFDHAINKPYTYNKLIRTIKELNSQ